MFEKEHLTFNPGWDHESEDAEGFQDVRELQRTLKQRASSCRPKPTRSTDGPASFTHRRSRRQSDPGGSARAEAETLALLHSAPIACRWKFGGRRQRTAVPEHAVGASDRDDGSPRSAAPMTAHPESAPVAESAAGGRAFSSSNERSIRSLQSLEMIVCACSAHRRGRDVARIGSTDASRADSRLIETLALPPVAPRAMHSLPSRSRRLLFLRKVNLPLPDAPLTRAMRHAHGRAGPKAAKDLAQRVKVRDRRVMSWKSLFCGKSETAHLLCVALSGRTDIGARRLGSRRSGLSTNRTARH